MHNSKKPVAQNIQLIAGFIIPTIILLFLSDESRLGPFYAMLLSLIFPVAVEVYAYFSGRKASYLSLFAIVGILLIGVISLLGLSEEWLAARRAAFYVISAIALLLITQFKPEVITKGLGLLLNIDKVQHAAKKKGAKSSLEKSIRRVAYTFGAMLLAIGAWSYIFTILFMDAPTGSSEFNAQYAELRLWSIPAITLPLLVGVVALLVYLFTKIERLTGLQADQLAKKR